MKASAWMVASLLALFALPPARGEGPRPPADGQAAPPQDLRRAVSEEALLRRQPVPPRKPGELSREERSKLRQDVSNAGRDLYPRPTPTRY